MDVAPAGFTGGSARAAPLSTQERDGACFGWTLLCFGHVTLARSATGAHMAGTLDIGGRENAGGSGEVLPVGVMH